MSERPLRTQRVERELREIASLFLQHEVDEPLPAFATITDVTITKDLRYATIFFRLSGEPSATATAKEMLTAQRNRMQKVVAKELPLKFCPVLRFEFGTTTKVDEIDELLWKLKAPRR
jgi:ribosome-binding factor A